MVYKRKKGVTPIIAIVLLLMLTVAAAGLAYVWVIQVQTETQESIGESVERQTQQLQARLTIDSVYKTGSNIAFVLRNAGTYEYTTTDLGQFSFYVDGAVATGSCSGLTTSGSTCTVSTTNAFPTVGNSKLLKIVPPLGSEVTYTCSIDESGQSYC